MKKSFFFLAIPLLTHFFSFSLQALEIQVEAKAAYFTPSDYRFNKMYSGNGLYNIELSVKTWQTLYVWAEAGVLSKSGHSLGHHRHRSHIKLEPLGLGVKYFFDVGMGIVHPYVSVGIQSTRLELHEHKHHRMHKSSNWGLGGVLNVGGQIDLTHNFFADIFVGGNLGRVHISRKNFFHTHSIDITGTFIGFGLGKRF